ncbi:MAG: zinc-dependent metalloprotease, partial [Planctomycetota bacterium]
PDTKFRDFDEVAKDYKKVVSTADGKPSLYTIWVKEKEGQMLAELPRGWERQKHFIAVTQASGGVFAGLQGPAKYVYWRRYGDRIALVEPELGTRSKGEQESKDSVDRLFTDRVLLDVPIVTMGPSGQPVIDADDLLLKNAGKLVGGGRGGVAGINSRLATVTKAKAFPDNVELAFEAPAAGGRLTTIHFSISNVPERSDYKPRVADERVGYFTTVYRDLGQYDAEKKWVRYIDRWHLEKRDPKLSVSPPKEPIVYYLEHTVPVRYRRWVRQGVLYWNDSFRRVGLDNAVEVRIQDKATGAHMDKDPEDVRYNFIRWLNNDISTAIGPHRAHPITGQILDADIVLTDGWIRAYWSWYHEQMPEVATQSLSPETLAWLEDFPDWDPRILLATPEKRERLLAERVRRAAAGEVAPAIDPILAENEELAAIGEWLGGEEHHCLAAHGMAFDMAMARLHFHTMEMLDYAGPETEGMNDTLDGIPEWFVGPMLSELTCHEVGHTLGLRHNFKASSVYTLEQINSEEWKGKKTIAGSVMDYLPANFNFGAGETQGDFTMIGVGPYDLWAIEYGYTFGDTDEVLKRVSEPELAYLTDDDTGGPDPLARRYDFSADPMDYAQNQMRIVEHHRERILDKFVKDGQSWSRARDGYQMTLSQQLRALSMMANWVGGSHVHRDRKGDPGDRAPVTVVDPEKQRLALQFCIDHAMHDEAFGLTPELLQYMTVDKWSDQSPGDRSDPTWPVHDRVAGVQGSVITLIMNPTTLQRVHDNEFRTAADEDALTL